MHLKAQGSQRAHRNPAASDGVSDFEIVEEKVGAAKQAWATAEAGARDETTSTASASPGQIPSPPSSRSSTASGRRRPPPLVGIRKVVTLPESSTALSDWTSRQVQFNQDDSVHEIWAQDDSVHSHANDLQHDTTARQQDAHLVGVSSPNLSPLAASEMQAVAIDQEGGGEHPNATLDVESQASAIWAARVSSVQEGLGRPWPSAPSPGGSPSSLAAPARLPSAGSNKSHGSASPPHSDPVLWPGVAKTGNITEDGRRLDAPATKQMSSEHGVTTGYEPDTSLLLGRLPAVGFTVEEEELSDSADEDAEGGPRSVSKTEPSVLLMEEDLASSGSESSDDLDANDDPAPGANSQDQVDGMQPSVQTTEPALPTSLSTVMGSGKPALGVLEELAPSSDDEE